MKSIALFFVAGILLLHAANAAAKNPHKAQAVLGGQDRNKDGKNDRFQDANGDGINDITGLPFQPQKFGNGQKRYGSQKSQSARPAFLDENGNGIDDRLEGKKGTGMKNALPEMRRGRMDRFIDEDGDGIADHRMNRLRFHRTRAATVSRGPRHGRGGRP